MHIHTKSWNLFCFSLPCVCVDLSESFGVHKQKEEEVFLWFLPVVFDIPFILAKTRLLQMLSVLFVGR